MTTLQTTEISPLRWGWLDRLASHFFAAYAGEEGDEGAQGESDPAVDDDDTAFGGSDDDDGDEGDEGDGEQGDQGEPQSKDDEDGEDDDDSDDMLFESDDEDEDLKNPTSKKVDDGDEGDEGEAGDEGDEADVFTPEEEAEHTESIERLDELWEARLERAKAKGEGDGSPLSVKLGSVQLRDDAKAKFKKVLEKEGEDAEIQAEAIFEIAMDAAMQTMEQYHHQDAQPRQAKARLSRQKATMDRRYDEFLKTPEGAAQAKSKDIQEKMQALFNKKAQDLGSVELAMRIPYKDYFRMVGGRVSKKARATAAAASKKAAAAKKAPKSKAKARKKADLAAARQPRARRAAGLTRQRKPKSEEQESAEYLQESSEPFFSVN